MKSGGRWKRKEEVPRNGEEESEKGVEGGGG